MAREAGFHCYNGCVDGIDADIKRFEALVRADERSVEREACAKVCDDGYDTFFANNGVEHSRKRYDQRAVERAIRAGVEFVTADCATAIRARGNT
jgi:flavin-dependent dehydrogenase